MRRPEWPAGPPVGVRGSAAGRVTPTALTAPPAAHPEARVSATPPRRYAGPGVGRKGRAAGDGGPVRRVGAGAAGFQDGFRSGGGQLPQLTSSPRTTPNSPWPGSFGRTLRTFSKSVPAMTFRVGPWPFTGRSSLPGRAAAEGLRGAVPAGVVGDDRAPVVLAAGVDGGLGGGEAGRRQGRVHAAAQAGRAGAVLDLHADLLRVDRHPQGRVGGGPRGQRFVAAQRVEEVLGLVRVPLQRRADALHHVPRRHHGHGGEPDDDGEKFRMARPRSSSSPVPNPSSARTEPSTARVTSRNRIGFSRIPDEVARSTSAARKCCCRRIRLRSDPRRRTGRGRTGGPRRP